MRKKNTGKNKLSFFKEQYFKSWKYIEESKDFIFAIILIFFFFTILGFIFPLPEEYSSMIINYLMEIINKTEGLSQAGLIKFIFINNIQSSFFTLVFGFLFGILPLFAAIFNGYVVGFVSAIAVEKGGFTTLLNFLPHGIFELPAIFISLGMGIKLGTFLFRKKKLESFKKFLWEGMRVFIFVVVPLLIIAAIIEGSLIAAGR